jgi:mono/diheme cytochrome c family protein
MIATRERYTRLSGHRWLALLFGGRCLMCETIVIAKRTFSFWRLLCATCAAIGLMISSSLLAAAPEIPAADKGTFQQKIRPIFQKYCFRCHGQDKQEAEFRIDKLGPDMVTEHSTEIWQELVNRVNGSKMPPKKEAQPTRAELEQLSLWAFGELKRAKIETGSHLAKLKRGRIETGSHLVIFSWADIFEGRRNEACVK